MIKITQNETRIELNNNIIKPIKYINKEQQQQQMRNQQIRNQQIRNQQMRNQQILSRKVRESQIQVKNIHNNNNINKTIYMTYKKQVPEKVKSRWINLNPDYKIELSLDNDCINFLRDNFNNNVAELFKRIPRGMHKADLWRLCKLYINGGVYADVDLVPYINLNELNKNVTFYTVLSMVPKSCFQAFMYCVKPKSPLILSFLCSFLHNKPFINNILGPTIDMYSCIRYNLGFDPRPNDVYGLNLVKIRINIGRSVHNIKKINLIYFPNDVAYKIVLIKTNYPDNFAFRISGNTLFVKRLDSNEGWEHNHACNICIQSNETISFFYENKEGNDYICKYNNKKMLDSRDLEYKKNGGW